MFIRISPFRIWLNSCPSTPCNSSRLKISSAPRVTATAASSGWWPAAKALIPDSCSSTYTCGTGRPEATAISSTIFTSLLTFRSGWLPSTRVPPSDVATLLPPPRKLITRYRLARPIKARMPSENRIRGYASSSIRAFMLKGPASDCETSAVVKCMTSRNIASSATTIATTARM